MKISIFVFNSVLFISLILFSCSAVSNNGNSGGSSSSASLAPGIYVSTNGSDSAVGTNASAPMRTIQLAISNAVTNNLTNIYVAEGTYSNAAGLIANSGLHVTNSGIWITNINIHLSGGWNGAFTSRSGTSLLNGNNQVKHVITVGSVPFTVSNIIIEGFTVMGGTANINPACGGGIYIAYADHVIISNTVISNNTATSWGGGITFNVCNNFLLAADITSNFCSSQGGGVFLYDCSAVLLNANIVKNTAGNNGGGIFINSGCSFVTQTGQVISNITATYGGGIYCAASSSVIQATNSWNFSTTGGGGLYLESSCNQMVITGTINNNCAQYGGGIYSTGNNILMTNIMIGKNAASYLGGGIYFDQYSFNCSIFGSISSNAVTNSGQGGAIYMEGVSNMTINSLVSYNSSSNQGGGIWAGYNSRAIRINGQISGNFAASYGGGIMLQLCTNVIITANITGNSTGAGEGSAILIDVSTNVQLLNSVLTNNKGNGIIATAYKNGILTISNCLIGGTNGDTYAGIIEAYENLTNQYLFDNTFITNTMGGLYMDYSYGLILNNQSGYLNNTNYTGATAASGNKVTNL